MKQFIVCFSGSRWDKAASVQPKGTLWIKRQTLLSLSTCRISILCWHSLSLSFFLSNTQFNYICLIRIFFPFRNVISCTYKFWLIQQDIPFVSLQNSKLAFCMLLKTNKKPRLTLAAPFRRRETWLGFYSTKFENDAVDSFFDNHGFCILFVVKIDNK